MVQGTRMRSFAIKTWADGSVHVVQLTGEFDSGVCGEFRDATRNLVPELLVIDLRGTTFIDSNALGALIWVHTRARERGFRLAIVRPTGDADRIFSITGTDGHLPLYDQDVPVLAEINYG